MNSRGQSALNRHRGNAVVVNGKPRRIQNIRNTNPYHPISPEEPDTGYWLNTNSNKRHNHHCPNYRKTRGRPCGPNEGQAAGCCGG